MFKLRTAAILLAGALALALAGCSATEFNRQLEDAMGSMARTKVTRIGSPARDCWLVKLNISKAYAVVVPKRILRLGEEFPQVSVVSQFSGSGVDYAVLQAVRANGAVENFLLQALSSTQVELYRLDSSSRLPFTVGYSNGQYVLMQDTDGGKVAYWLVGPSSVRGPSITTRSQLAGGKSARKSSGKSKKSPKSGSSGAQTKPENVDLPMADLPNIQQDTSVRLEVDTPPESASQAPAVKSEPVVVEQPRVTAPASQGAASAPAASGGAAQPYTIVVD
ncbi:MAG: hypothetical protein HDQ89_00045 [Desulfovibrio sp.]|nr:hypothetical protein [Desulfovibrio sp.]